jgi:hypothetical protein
VAVLIWGTIIVRIFTQFKNPPDVMLRQEAHNDDYLDQAVNRDSMVLLMNYPDPFFHTIQKDDPEQTHHNRKINENRIPETVSWPPVFYKGQITNREQGSSLYLISIGQQNYLMNPGDIRDQMKLIKANADSILLEWEHYKRFFKKEGL